MPILPRAGQLLALTILAACSAAPPLTARHDADRAAIDSIYDAGPRAVAAADVDAYLRLLDDSAALLFPAAPAARGKVAVRAMLEGMFAAGSHTATLSPRRIGVADSLAYAEYSGVFVSRPLKGDSVVGRLRYVDVLRRQPDGSWRLLIHSAHPDVAP